MKKNMFCVILIFSLFNVLNVYAATVNTPVGKDLTMNVCTSFDNVYQDNKITTATGAYFSHCMKATCSNRKYTVEKYYKDYKVFCSNGNSNPKITVVKNGCSDYENNVCGNNEIKYCSKVLYYDCTKKFDGTLFTTTKKTTPKKTTTKYTGTTKKSTTTSTTTTVVSDPRLQSLTLSNGSISFNPDVYEYNIMVENDINAIEVNAVAIDITSQISISGNSGIVNGSLITITVTTVDNKVSTYKINVEKKQEILSNNTKLKSLSITNYTLPFNPKIYNYSLIIDADISTLEINYQVDDEKSSVDITGNENLKDGSKIVLTVNAEDGSVQNYTIDIKVKKKSNFLSILFIIIVIVALGAGGFYLYKKFFAGKNGEKYEYE